MATSQLTPDADAIVSQIHVAAPPERVFQALVDPKQVVQWWGQKGVFRCTEFIAICVQAGNGAAVAWTRRATSSK